MSLIFLSLLYLLNILYWNMLSYSRGLEPNTDSPVSFHKWAQTCGTVWMWNDHTCVRIFGLHVVALLWKLGSGWRKWVSWMTGLEAHNTAPLLFHLCFLINPAVSKQPHTPASTAMSYSCHHVFLFMMAIPSDHEPEQSFLRLSQGFGHRDKTENICNPAIGLPQTTPS